MAPVVFLEVGGRASAGWYSSLSEGEAGGAGGAADWVVGLVVGPAVAAAAERETRSVGTGRAVLFLLREAGGPEEDMVMVVVVLEA
jgi:hypothetical protein